MKRILTLLLTFVLLLSSTVTVFAADGKVTYSGNAGSFVFEPGSDHSLTGYGGGLDAKRTLLKLEGVI